MPTLCINNSYSTLEKFPSNIMELVRKELTYRNKEVGFEKQRLGKAMQIAQHRGNLKYFYALKKQLSELPPEIVCLLKGNQFPSGLLDRVEMALERAKYGSYELRDERVRPKPYHIFRWRNKPSLRYYQEEMVKRGVEVGRGVFSASIGSGKTLTAVALTKELGVNTLFIAPSVALRDQAAKVYSQVLGPKHVSKITTTDATKKLKSIRVVTIQTLNSLRHKNMLELVTKDVDCMFIDEAHRQGAASYIDLLPDLSHVYYRFSMTGTFLRNDSRTMELHSVTSKILYHYPPSKAAEEGYIVKPTLYTKIIWGNAHKNYQKEYKMNYCSNPEMFEWVASLIKTSIPQEDPVLVLVEQKETAGKVMSDWFEHMGIPHIYLSGDDKKKKVNETIEAFNEGKVRVLIATKILGEGVDLVAARHLINLQGGKGVTKFVQAIGRAVRLHPGKVYAKIYDVHFKNTNYLEKHTQIRIQTFKEWFEGETILLDD